MDFVEVANIKEAGPNHTQKLFMEKVMLLLKDSDRQAKTGVQERWINWKSGSTQRLKVTEWQGKHVMLVANNRAKSIREANEGSQWKLWK